MASPPNSQQIVGPEQAALGLPRPPSALGPEEAGAFNVGDVWRIIKQRKLTVIITFVVLFSLVVGLTFLVYRFWPQYPAEALLELVPPPREAMGIERELIDTEIMEFQLATEAQKVKQLGLLREVLKLPEIKETYFYKWYQEDIRECLFELQELVQSQPIRDTNLIRVGIALQKRKEAPLLVRSIVRRYLSMYGEQAHEELLGKTQSLRDTLSELRDQLDAKRAELASFQAGAEIPATERAQGTAGQEYIAQLKLQLSEINVGTAALQSQLDFILAVNPRNLPITPEMQIIVESDPILRFYRSQVETSDAEIQAALQSIGPEHRQIRTMDARRQVYREKEVAKREELLTQLRARQVDSIQQSLAEWQTMQTRLQDELEQAEAEQRDLDSSIQRYFTMVKDEEDLRENIQDIAVKLAEAEHALKDQTRFQVHLIQQAVEAEKPSRPRFPFWIGGGFVLSWAGAIGLAFLREFTDQAIRTPIDVARHGQLPVLGSIPLLDDEEADVDEIELATRRAPQSLVAEAFRQVRTNLLFSGPAESQRSILITSPGPDDGKTAAAINLAVTLAQGSQRVLLIDCNFRRPAIRNAFPNTRSEGLSNILIGQAKLSDLITKTELPNVDVLSSGPMPPTPAELLSSTYMRDLIQEATQKYDRVVFDGPPVLLISDTLVIATQVNTTILVSRAISNTKGALKRAREQLERINAHVVGAILNGVQASPGGYFKQQYRDFYDYVSDEMIPPALPGAPQEAEDESAGDKA